MEHTDRSTVFRLPKFRKKIIPLLSCLLPSDMAIVDSSSQTLKKKKYLVVKQESAHYHRYAIFQSIASINQEYLGAGGGATPTEALQSSSSLSKSAIRKTTPNRH